MARRKTTSSKSTSADDPATAWARDVAEGRVVAGPHVRNACKRHLLDLVEGPKRGLVWDVAAAKRAIDFFPEMLRLNGGQFEGRPFYLHPSQAFKTGSLFGWKRADGTRRFRRAFIEEGKGNGKSPWAAGTGLYCMLADGEARAEVYAAGKDKDQAMVLFRDAVAMVDQSPRLAKRLTRSGGNPVWQLSDLTPGSRTFGSWFKPISRDQAKSGPRPSCALCDEVHEHPNRDVIGMLEAGFKFRRQPLLAMITNSGFDRTSVCWEEHQRAIRVAAGTREPDDEFTFVGEVIDDETFAFVCGLDKDDDPLEDPACWIKANPLLGTILTEDYLASRVREAKLLPSKMNEILRLNFCVWTDADAAWMSRTALEAVLEEFNPTDLSGETVFAGVDLSATQDMTAVAFVVPTGPMEVPGPEGGMVEKPTYMAWVEAWTPADTLDERATRDQQPYEVWVRDGWLMATPGKLIGMEYPAVRMAQIQAEYRLTCIAYDAYAFRKNFEPKLDEAGVTAPLVEHPQAGKRRAQPSEEQKRAAAAEGREAQGLWMPGSVNELEALILEGRIRIRTSPVAISAIMGAAVEKDVFGNRWFSKRKATTRIDALVALAMAVGAATAGVSNGSTNPQIIIL